MKKIRKIVLLLCVLSCVFALTACGNDGKKEAPFEYSVSELVNVLTTNTETVADWDNATIKDVIKSYDEDDDQDKILIAGLEQFMDIRKEVGEYEGFYLDENGDAKYSVSQDDESVTVKAKAKFSKRDVKITFTFTELHNEIYIENILYEPQYSLGETMKRAAMNTIIGICTVICVLFFLSILIAQFVHVEKLQRFLEKIKDFFKKNKNNELEDEEDDDDIFDDEPVTSSNEMDDTELVAVITAAIAAGSRNASTDGFVVRSIKRVSTRKW